MDYPECMICKVRVFTSVGCSCGHHPLLCDSCGARFEVDCGPPIGPAKLPPEYPIMLDKEAMEDIKPLFAQFQPEEVRAKFPLLEDFRAALAVRAPAPPA